MVGPELFYLQDLAALLGGVIVADERDLVTVDEVPDPRDAAESL